ncbi:MAG: 2-phospho-L-lactate transferase CofD family protein [Desulfosarcinaceae bacterium]|nr:2-phospho-L-lactate transferase CofD family protein [Desulfosarcinaceae bacterium]
MTATDRTQPTAPRRIRLTRSIPLPNPVAVARCQRLPELGPRILFFSGGTALRQLSRELVAYTHNSIHLITPFDSGGSSAVLRRAFDMPAVGDIRNRLMALADRSFTGNPHIVDLFAYRFSKGAANQDLHTAYATMADGQHPLVAVIPDPMRKIIRQHLYDFQQRMPTGFDLRGAPISGQGRFWNRLREWREPPQWRCSSWGGVSPLSAARQSSTAPVSRSISAALRPASRSASRRVISAASRRSRRGTAVWVTSINSVACN